jgi:hypothetical protein
VIPVLGAIQGLSVGQKIAGAVLSLVIWLAPAGAVWLYMKGQAGAQFELGSAEARATCADNQATALATAIEDARLEWQKTQAAIDGRAADDAERIANTLAAAQRHANKLTKELEAHATANPLPSGCRADPDRRELYNRSRGSGPPEA